MYDVTRKPPPPPPSPFRAVAVARQQSISRHVVGLSSLRLLLPLLLLTRKRLLNGRKTEADRAAASLLQEED